MGLTTGYFYCSVVKIRLGDIFGRWVIILKLFSSLCVHGSVSLYQWMFCLRFFSVSCLFGHNHLRRRLLCPPSECTLRATRRMPTALIEHCYLPLSSYSLWDLRLAVSRSRFRMTLARFFTHILRTTGSKHIKWIGLCFGKWYYNPEWGNCSICCLRCFRSSLSLFDLATLTILDTCKL